MFSHAEQNGVVLYPEDFIFLNNTKQVTGDFFPVEEHLLFMFVIFF